MDNKKGERHFRRWIRIAEEFDAKSRRHYLTRVKTPVSSSLFGKRTSSPPFNK
jgi:hypothetical protein